MLSTEATSEVLTIRAKYPSAQSALMPALRVAERHFGWLSPDALEFTALTLGLPKATVRGVASFYNLYRHKPMGRHMVQLCANVSCMLFGADDLKALLKKQYGLEPGGTSPDGRFSLLIMECIGACDEAPAMMVNEDLHGSLTAQNIIEILERYR